MDLIINLFYFYFRICLLLINILFYLLNIIYVKVHKISFFLIFESKINWKFIFHNLRRIICWIWDFLKQIFQLIFSQFIFYRIIKFTVNNICSLSNWWLLFIDWNIKTNSLGIFKFLIVINRSIRALLLIWIINLLSWN